MGLWVVGASGQRGSRCRSGTIVVKWTNSGFVGPGGQGQAISRGQGVIPAQ